MNKDFEPSKKYTEEELLQVHIPYRYKDSCIDYYYEYKLCEMKNNKLKLFLNTCKNNQKIWKNCQDQREEELENKLKKLKKKNK